MSEPRRSGGVGADSGEDSRERRRRVERVFGESEPVTTSDERDPEGGGFGGGFGDDWWRDQRPPHH